MQIKITISLLIIGASVFVYWKRLEQFKNPYPANFEVETEPAVEPEPVVFHGYVIDGLNVEEALIKRNQNISEILSEHNISREQIHELARVSKDKFDVRKIVTNRKYSLICDTDSLHTAQALIYEPNEIDLVIFNLKDSISVYTKQREVDTVHRMVSGIIENSLAVAMDEMGLIPQLTNDFADVFAWEVDFFRLFPQDKFKVIYEEILVEDKPVDIGRILGAYFKHHEEEFYAFYYQQKEGEDYFDMEGNSLRKALLKYPVEFSRISSRYTGRRYHPVLKRYKAHLGTDFAAPRGTPIRTVGDGVILEARYGRYNGNFVKIKHNGIYTTQYLHMTKIARGIRPGVRVKQGQVIGFVGSTGLARGSHLCYRFWKNGYQVDALKVDIPPSEPIKDSNREEFLIIRDEMKERLDAIPYQEKPEKLYAKGI